MGRDAGGMDWLMDQNVNNQTFGSWASTVGTLTCDTLTPDTGMLSTGWASTSTIVITASQTLTLNKGDVISIAGVFPVNPQNRQAYGTKTKNFVVQTTVTDAGTTANLTVSPAIIYGGQFQNCVFNSTASTAAITAVQYRGDDCNGCDESAERAFPQERLYLRDGRS